MKKALVMATAALSLFACNNDTRREVPGDTNLSATDALNKVNPDTAGKQDIIIIRTFDAPLEALWKAWTDREHVMRWWGPRFYTSCNTTIDLREGGRYIFCMKAPADQGGQEMYTSGVYKKIVPLQYLEFGQGLSDKDGNPIDPAVLKMPPDFPKETRTTLVFKADGGKTELTVTEYDWKRGQMRDYSEMGMNECLDKLAVALMRK